MIYLDNAATTKANPLVIESFNKIEDKFFANPSSTHAIGMGANSYLDKARKTILDSFHLENHSVTFVASSTEANNLFIKGYCLAHHNRGNKIITTNIEHPSVSECFKQLHEQFGFEVVILPVNGKGVIEPKQLIDAMDNNVILVSIMAINNEIGSIFPIDELANIVHKYPKAVLHSDTTQAIGKHSFNYQNIDAFVISGHKIEGLKGSGCLIMKKGITLLPLISGGGQEDNLRSGTVSTALAVSLAKAVLLANKNLDEKLTYVKTLKNHLISRLVNHDDIVVNSNDDCSPYIVNFSLKQKKAAVVVMALSQQNIYISSISACHSKHEKSSFVIKALTNDDRLAGNTLRVSFSPSNTINEIDEMLDSLFFTLRSIQ